MAKRWIRRVLTYPITCQWWSSTYYPMYNYWWISNIMSNNNDGKSMELILFWLILQGCNLRICVNLLINLLFNLFVPLIFDTLYIKTLSYYVLITILGDENAFGNGTFIFDNGLNHVFDKYNISLLTVECLFNGPNKDEQLLSALLLFIILARGVIMHDEFVHNLYVIADDKCIGLIL